jgi:6-phosphofructokinase 1
MITQFLKKSIIKKFISMKQKVFFSYSFKHHLIIEYFYSMLSKYADDYFEIFFYDRIYHEEFWGEVLKKAIVEKEIFVYFLGRETGTTQKKELEYWENNREPNDKKRSILVIIEDLTTANIPEPEGFDKTVSYRTKNEEYDIFSRFTDLYFKLRGVNFTYPDGLPSNSQLFNYEKDIINFYTSKYFIGENLKGINDLTNSFKNKDKIEKIEEILRQGVTPSWPKVKINLRIEEIKEEGKKYEKINNPIIKEIGTPRKANVLAAALTNYHEIESNNSEENNPNNCLNFCLKDHSLSFPEAGPREYIYKPINIPFAQHYNVAILVTGGIAPGINAVIDGITQRHFKYAIASGYLDKLRVIGLKNGFKSFDNDFDKVLLYPNKQLMGEGTQNAIITSEMINVGGSMIGTSRYEKLEIGNDSRMSELNEIIHSLKKLRINMLYIIGGEGSMKAAHALATIYEMKFPQSDQWRFNIVGIPKTMDNDILWVWQTFGFMSAVEKAREFIDYLAVETSSNPRVGIVQLFGSNSGFVVSHAVLASRTGICDFALIPESPYRLSKLIPALEDTLMKKKKNYGLIIMSETAIPVDALDYLNKYKNEICLTKLESEALDKYFNIDNQNIKGHIDDKLRDASFKIVKFSIEKEIDFRVLTNEPRHLIRAIPPSTIDIINASRLGTLAVDNAIAGYTDFMVSQWLTEYCLVPLDLVVLGRKRIPNDGIFWKSVIAKTGQPEKLD